MLFHFRKTGEKTISILIEAVGLKLENKWIHLGQTLNKEGGFKTQPHTMQAKNPSQAKPVILFDVTPATYRSEGWGYDFY